MREVGPVGNWENFQSQPNHQPRMTEERFQRKLPGAIRAIRGNEYLRGESTKLSRRESHYVQGRRYRLNVVERNASHKVSIRNKTTLELCVRPGTDRESRQLALQRWYRQLMRAQLPELIAKWEPVIRVKIAECSIKKMKTRWGSCNLAARRIWLNLELAKKPPSCLEYILVHEMVHVLERHHNDRFREYMDRFMPQWRIRREELGRAPLSHESWDYWRGRPESRQARHDCDEENALGSPAN
jgi:predicted metal-dependent hydrolase